MSEVLGAVLGGGAQDLVDALSRADSVTSEYVLRTGRSPHESPTVPAQVATPPAGLHWAALRRLTASGAADPSDLTVGIALNALNRIGEQVWIRIARQGSAQTISIGFHSAPSMHYVRSLLAPRVVLEPTDAPSTGAAPARGVVVRFRPTPGEHREPDQVRAPSLLDRILDVTGVDWELIIGCRPAAAADLQTAMLDVGEIRRIASSEMTSSRAVDEVTTVQATDPVVERIVAWLTTIHERLSSMCSTGGWLTDISICCADHHIAWQLAAATCARGPRSAAAQGAVWVSDTFDGAPSASWVAGSLLDSHEIASFLEPPAGARAGIAVGAAFPTDRGAVSSVRQEVWLGTWLGTDQRASIDLDDLEGHAFIAGVTGSGKTTTVARILVSAWNRHRVPFLVIDPVKDDYAALASRVAGGLRLVQGRDLRFNVLRPAPGYDPAVHLDLVASAFKGAFSMPSPVPYVVSLLFDDLRELAAAGRHVTLHDLRRAVGPMVRELGYRGELEANILASLGVRLSVLCAPSRAQRLCSPTDITELFDDPVVVSLADIGDDEERAFLMSALTILIAEHARTRGANVGVRHLTVIEEAHRMVAEPRPSSDITGDAQGHAARLVSQLLAEIRSFGETILVLDQSPAAVARDVLRNTNTKILHRLLDPEDRELLGGAVGLEPEATRFLTELLPGEAIVATRRLSRPQAVLVEPLATSSGAGELRAAPAVVTRTCCGTAERRHQAAEIMALEAGDAVGAALTALLVDSDASAVAGVGPWLDEQLARVALQSRHGAQVDCLRLVGARVAVDRWVEQSWIDIAEADRLSDLVTVKLGSGHVALAPSDLPRVPAARVKPFDGCAGCGSACWVRPLGRHHRELATLRELYARHAPVSEAAAQTIAGSVRQSLAPLLGWAAAGDVARCAAVHAGGRYEPDSAQGVR